MPRYSHGGSVCLSVCPVIVIVISCKPAEAEQKASLSSLAGSGFEIKGTIAFSGLNMVLVQKDKDIAV